MLNTSLTTLQSLLKAEIGNELSVVTAQDQALATLLMVGQRDLADRFDWPHLKLSQNVTVPAATQYVNIPTELNFDRPIRVSVQQGNVWLQVGYGIDEIEYNTYDSSAGATASPVMKWQRYLASQFEVWPLGNIVQTLRFVGQKRLPDLTGEQPAMLDDLLLVYYVAAQYLTRLKNAQAPLEISKFRDRFAQLRANAPQRSGIAVLGGRIPGLGHARRYNIHFGAQEPEVEPGVTSPTFGSDSYTFGNETFTFGTD